MDGWKEEKYEFILGLFWRFTENFTQNEKWLKSVYVESWNHYGMSKKFKTSEDKRSAKGVGFNRCLQSLNLTSVAWTSVHSYF